MKIVIFGLSVSSSWGNGHATLWRGLIRALGQRGHTITFYERDVPYYAAARDLNRLEGGRLVLYQDWQQLRGQIEPELAAADVGIVTSFCPDARGAADLLLGLPRPVSVFYDLDTPVTLAAIERGIWPDYVPAYGLGWFDLVLSYTGGPALQGLTERLGARQALPLYGSVDPRTHHPAAPLERFRADLSYLGTYASDRDEALKRFLIDPAQLLPNCRFLIGGAQYAHDFNTKPHVVMMGHISPAEHAAFYSSTRLTLNITRKVMAEMGYCPSARLFEAAACGAAIISDEWEGISQFFTPGSEILIARTTEDVLIALDQDDFFLKSMGASARERALAEHSCDRRAIEFEAAIDSVDHRTTATQSVMAGN